MTGLILILSFCLMTVSNVMWRWERGISCQDMSWPHSKTL